MLIAFALGLFLSLGHVTGLKVREVNLKIWDVDDSCKPYLSLLQKAFDDAATMSAKALKDLKFVQQPRPQQDTKRRESLEWDRIARAVNNIFGFNPDEQGTNSENKFMQKVLGVYDRMSAALRGNENIPAKGFTELHSKALLICGDEPWKWYSVNDIDPYDPERQPLHISQPGVEGKGAWAYKHRYHSNGNPNSIGICRPEIYAVTQPHLSRVMIHELTHWYGAELDKEGAIIRRKKSTDIDNPAAPKCHWLTFSFFYLVVDHRAVSKYGELPFSYFDQSRNKVRYVPSSKRKDGVRYGEPVVYYYAFVTRLAMSHEGQFAQNSGPDKATGTAEAYAYFAMMA
ncbi:hypothetical protein N5P37_007849 [Trichoderma harzianum]|uniref:Lysine-specific metallo-endopeptidase domain-containing protein n=1 Tax=Trichoderma harzianum CBS 226.95 TaxID=983964 RepID=A0A2T4A3X7_TRIHA|nr:hypothetical protein M431DRAFT_484720 [Trichoderma harzianum CBS 226.95]KAK0759661.1 hypothetical protein N5P37_007849 [Trichoderma harzianum]PTB51761.1 hypothetical protein M431DRAFT_484720 [Trichoderma harzianum CBS 226.95]